MDLIDRLIDRHLAAGQGHRTAYIDPDLGEVTYADLHRAVRRYAAVLRRASAATGQPRHGGRRRLRDHRRGDPRPVGPPLRARTGQPDAGRRRAELHRRRLRRRLRARGRAGRPAAGSRAALRAPPVPDRDGRPGATPTARPGRVSADRVGASRRIVAGRPGSAGAVHLRQHRRPQGSAARAGRDRGGAERLRCRPGPRSRRRRAVHGEAVVRLRLRQLAAVPAGRRCRDRAAARPGGRAPAQRYADRPATHGALLGAAPLPRDAHGGRPNSGRGGGRRTFVPGRPRLAVSAGEHLPADLRDRFEDRFGVPLVNGLGATEVLHIVVTDRRAGRPTGRRPVPPAGRCPA